MDNGDKVYILFGENRFGPFKVDNWMSGGPVALLVNPDGGTFYFDKDYIERVEPELEDERWYFLWDDDSRIVPRAYRGKDITVYNWDYIEPVYRRVDEMTHREVEGFFTVLHHWKHGQASTVEVLKEAYNLITGEKHP